MLTGQIELVLSRPPIPCLEYTPRRCLFLIGFTPIRKKPKKTFAFFAPSRFNFHMLQPRAFVQPAFVFHKNVYQMATTKYQHPAVKQKTPFALRCSLFLRYVDYRPE